ncbi:MAG: polymer-forming cytoskeletal protein [Phycisphaeraceae bacterium]
MARHAGPRTVQCYHCHHRFEVGGRAQSTSCPGCNKPVIVGDMVIKQLKGPLKEVRTCGRIEIHKRGRVLAELIEAHGGIECLGTIDAQRVLSGRPVTLGPKSRFKGDLTAPSLKIQKGARIDGGRFTVPDDALGLGDLEG